jgi:putative peptidoglycan lipid II flippase
VAAGTAAVHCALLYTDRRFAPAAFYQASLNVFTIAGALCLWKWLGVYGFAIGYSAGAWAQCLFLWRTARKDLDVGNVPPCEVRWREILRKPAFFLVYAGGVALNITFTRAYATNAGPGMAAALDYCMRGVGVPLAFLVSPISNSLLPEIARLRSVQRLAQAFRLIDKTVGLAALAAVAGCGFAIAFRHPAIVILFQRGSFTAQSTELVSAVFLGLGPSLVGWALLEISARALFALDRPALPVAAALIPVTVNVAITLWMHAWQPELVGVGSSVGLLTGFVALFVLSRTNRRRWLAQG